LAALGFRVTIPIPGFSFPTVVGPFNYLDARANFTETASLTGLRNWRSSRELTRAADLSIKDSREIVTLAVANAYLQLISSAARVETVRVQIVAAQAVYQQAVDRNKSGLNARIDVNRSLVELQTQRQRLTSFINDFEKQKIALARMIGLPLAQVFTLADTIPYRELPVGNLDEMIGRAMRDRADVQASAAQVKAAEITRKASVAEYYPVLELSGDYGALGINPSQSHGTFIVSGGVRFPIFRFGRIRADIDQANAALSQRRAEYEDVRRRAEQEVRSAVLDITTASQQVTVADSNRTLAGETLVQARDRFRAGVADTIEVVQAQESVASAEQDYINALYQFNVAQVSLARSEGAAGEGVARLLRGR
jgi:outer membrane protein TolC